MNQIIGILQQTRLGTQESSFSKEGTIHVRRSSQMDSANGEDNSITPLREVVIPNVHNSNSQSKLEKIEPTGEPLTASLSINNN